MRTRPDPAQVQELQELLQEFVSVQDAAEALGVTVPAIHSRIAFGTLIAVRVGSGWAIPREEIERIQHTYYPDDEAAEGKQLADA